MKKTSDHFPDITGLFGESPADEARVECEISSDDMRAICTLYPPGEAGRPLEPDDIHRALDGLGVVDGFRRKAIERAVFRCNTERRVVRGLVAATGKKPTNRIPEHIRLEDLLGSRRATASGGRIDHRSWQRPPVVRVGEKLGMVVEETPGEPGKTVQGAEIPFKAIEVPRVPIGDNVVVDGTTIRSVIDGVVHLDRTGIRVSPVLQLATGIDYRTGNIDFIGDVMLQGEVRDGFKLTCTGLLEATGVLDVTKIECGSLHGLGGIVGKGDAELRVNGEVQAKFIEHLILRADGDVIVSGGISGSTITTGGRLLMGEQGAIVGSIIMAQGGVEIFRAGASTGTPLEIHCGIDFGVKEQLENVRDRTIDLAAKLQAMRQARKAGNPTAPPTTAEEHLQTQITGMNDLAVELVMRLDTYEDAEILVHGPIFPGVYLEICHRSYAVGKEMRGMKFRLDKTSGRIVAESFATGSERSNLRLHKR